MLPQISKLQYPSYWYLQSSAHCIKPKKITPVLILTDLRILLKGNY